MVGKIYAKYKIYARVVCDRLRLLTDAVLMDEQGGFRVRRGCVDQIFAVRQVIEKVIEKTRWCMQHL